MKITHPKLNEARGTDGPRAEAEVSEREFESVWKARGWVPADDEPAGDDEGDERPPLDDEYDGMDLAALKDAATVRGIEFASNIGADTLRERLREADDADDE